MRNGHTVTLVFLRSKLAFLHGHSLPAGSLLLPGPFGVMHRLLLNVRGTGSTKP
jgi:hypothetical protein